MEKPVNRSDLWEPPVQQERITSAPLICDGFVPHLGFSSLGPTMGQCSTQYRNPCNIYCKANSGKGALIEHQVEEWYASSGEVPGSRLVNWGADWWERECAGAGKDSGRPCHHILIHILAQETQHWSPICACWIGGVNPSRLIEANWALHGIREHKLSSSY